MDVVTRRADDELKRLLSCITGTLGQDIVEVWVLLDMDFIHDHGCKGYMTLNIYAHNDDIPVLRDYIGKIKDIPIDAFLVSDPGVMGLIKEQIPDAEIHLSTQANTTNYLTAAFWVNQGVKRIVAAREISLAELTEMRRHGQKWLC